MKKSILLLAAALPFALSAKDVKITRPAASLDNDTLTLSFRFNVEEVKVNSEQSYTFTPVLVNGNEHLVLAPMAVSGKKNYKMPRKIRRPAVSSDSASLIRLYTEKLLTAMTLSIYSFIPV